MNRSRMLVNEDEIYNDSFGLWISGLFSAISGHSPDISFASQKQVFFILLRKWLDEGKIHFCHPDDPLGKPWAADADEIIHYLQERWPKSAEVEDDSDLNLYFYEIPAILWVGPNGELVGS